MFSRLGNLIARYWLLVILLWIAAAVSLRWTAPRWEDVAYDGDFAYLPADCPSVVGERLLAEAFPHRRSKSQIVVVVARDREPLSREDILVANDLACRFRNLQGIASFERAKALAAEAAQDREPADRRTAALLRQQSEEALQSSVRALEEAIRLDRELAKYRAASKGRQSEGAGAAAMPRLAAAYHNLAIVKAYLGEPGEAANYRQLAAQLDPALAARGDRPAPDGAADWPLVDVWTWHDEVVGEKLISRDKHARLIILHLSNEFLATDNIHVLEKVEALLAGVRRDLDRRTQPGLILGVSGSAAVGGDMLRAARDSIRHTELFTIIFVVLILAVVYRSPLLVAVPLATISCSFWVATGAVALLTQLDRVPGFGWWDLKVFTTTKIFIVVILFGSGTDFCLFLISRYKEQLDRGLDPARAAARSVAAVGQAVAASALTTILGLSMMFFAEFGKFSHSGPVIGLCLAVTLVSCLTLAPAMLRAAGRSIFWPFGLTKARSAHAEPGRASLGAAAPRSSPFEACWQWLARGIVVRPGLILTVCLLVLMPLAGYGIAHSNDVTYDFLSALSPSRPSRQGAELLRRHFPVGESGPVTVLVRNDRGAFDTMAGRLEIAKLTRQLYLPPNEALEQLQRTHPQLRGEIQQVLQAPEPARALARLRQIAGRHAEARPLLAVAAVRSVSDPLGDFPPGKRIGILSRSSWHTRMMRPHKLVQKLFVAQTPEMTSNIARFDVVLQYEPFSLEANHALARIDQKLREISSDPASDWHGCAFAYAGTTAAIRDLRQVTQSDQVRIQILVVLAVSAVLLLILRRPLVCAYMVASVLLSYFVTLGATQLFCGLVYGDSFQGLDWKVPVFLFVILVAVGQDYNIYLATRVFEEQQRYGPFAGLRRAVVQTGGIITSCGVIMAGTFISMTSGAWSEAIPAWVPFSQWLLPPSAGTLSSMIQLGFALSLGVLLDTFVVRPILLPAFLALLCRWQTLRAKRTQAGAPPLPAAAHPAPSSPPNHVG